MTVGARSRTGQVLFVQGGGARTHDEWDGVLVESLSRELGAGYEVRYPRMPQEDEPSYARWSVALRQELADLDDGAVVVGHSIGGTILVQTLAEHPDDRALDAIVLVSAPFVGADGWSATDLELATDLGERLPAGVPVHVFHGLRDDLVPPAHAALYARAIPGASVELLAGRDHQLDGDLGEVARVIRGERDRDRVGG